MPPRKKKVVDVAVEEGSATATVVMHQAVDPKEYQKETVVEIPVEEVAEAKYRPMSVQKLPNGFTIVNS